MIEKVPFRSGHGVGRLDGETQLTGAKTLARSAAAQSITLIRDILRQSRSNFSKYDVGDLSEVVGDKEESDDRILLTFQVCSSL